MFRNRKLTTPEWLRGRTGTARRALQNSLFCGDDFACWACDDIIYLLIVDGLGHGREAQKAAKAAVEFCFANLPAEPRRLFRDCDEALRKTRGVALGLAEINVTKNEICFSGIGNTRCLLIDRTGTALFNSDYGIIGGGFKRLRTETKAISDGDLVILFTDGVRESLRESVSICLRNCDLNEVAGALMQKWAYPTDDAAILIYKHEATDDRGKD